MERMTATMPEWAREFRARYAPKFLDWEAWEVVFNADMRRNDLPDWTDAQMVRAIRWMNAERWTEPKTAIDCIKGLRAMRKRESGGGEGAPMQPGCGLCNGGSLSWQTDYDAARTYAVTYKGMTDEQVTHRAMFGHSEVIPCPCSLGEHLRSVQAEYKALDGDKLAKFRKRQDFARRQQIYVAACWARLSAGWTPPKRAAVDIVADTARSLADRARAVLGDEMATLERA